MCMLQGGRSAPLGTPKATQGGRSEISGGPRAPPRPRAGKKWVPGGALWAARGRFGGPWGYFEIVKKPLVFILF